MPDLRVSPELSLPIEAVTETFSILAKRGAGKTYTANVLVEEMLEARLQVVVLDPMGAWYGLRSSADGKGPGYPIAILGGDHADVPLEQTAGVVVADLIVDERLSAVLDMSLWSKTARRQFVADFLERLYHRNREAMHLVLEEADLFAPEGSLRDPGDQRMLGAVYDIVRRGRGRGIGSTLVTQRSASISKEVLDQTEILIALRTTGPRDRKAIEGWINVHADEAEAKVVMDSLPSLPTGTAWVWWPVEGILRQVHVRSRRTFDSSATPRPGERRQAPKTVADVDLVALQTRMAATIEKAKADDPKALRRQIADLTKQLAQRPTETTVETKEVRVEVPVLNGQVDKLAEIVGQLREIGSGMIIAGTGLAETANSITAAIGRVQSTPMLGRVADGPRGVSEPRRETPVSRGQRPPVEVAATRPLVAARPVSDVETGEARRLDAGARRMLVALAQLHPTPLLRSQLGTLADVAWTSGTFRGYLSSLRTSGLIEEPDKQTVALSAAGVDAMADQLGVGAPSVEDLVAMWNRKLDAGARRMLGVLVDIYPEGITRTDLGERVEISASSGTFRGYLSNLRVNRLLDESGGLIRAGEALFIGGGR